MVEFECDCQGQFDSLLRSHEDVEPFRLVLCERSRVRGLTIVNQLPGLPKSQSCEELTFSVTVHA